MLVHCAGLSVHVSLGGPRLVSRFLSFLLGLISKETGDDGLHLDTSECIHMGFIVI